MREFNPFFKKFSSKAKKIAVIYPNRYVGGISNTGIQRLYFEVNREEKYIAERFYTDVFNGLRSVESATPLEKFDVALFSIQYEEDAFSAVRILSSSGFSGKKIAGGPCITQNPFPYLKHFDRVFIGEAENAVRSIVEDELTDGLFPLSNKRRVVSLDTEMKRQIVADGAYGKAILIEMGRGCPRGCRFCIVRQIYSPPRWRSRDSIIEIAEENIGLAGKVALIAPSPTDHPEFLEIVSELQNMGYEVSPSSIRADRFDEEHAELLGDVKTLTLAPEAGSERLREVLNKGISEEDVMQAAEISSAKKIKLYFMFGLPGETYSDLDEIVRMVEKIRNLGKSVQVSINPLVPKPHTPFQWLPYGGDLSKNAMENIKELKKKRDYLYSKLRRIADVEIENIERFAVQTVISRGDESMGDFLDRKVRLSTIRKFRLERFLEGFSPDYEFPWDRIDMGYRKNRIRREFEISMEKAGIEF
ncbi:radical SAM protein [Geoglobus acetivorans]|uniref:Radical SAM protein n=1 Tax=Geoglobus acetivorans TaxID=565033 RepID=A0ABZ3H3W1_GEOAI|nr:radical SAM protein [Geoglobus acetivorans]